MQNKARKNYIIYVLMLLLFGGLIYVAIEEGDRFSHHAANTIRYILTIRSLYRNYFTRNPSKI